MRHYKIDHACLTRVWQRPPRTLCTRRNSISYKIATMFDSSLAAASSDDLLFECNPYMNASPLFVLAQEPGVRIPPRTYSWRAPTLRLLPPGTLNRCRFRRSLSRPSVLPVLAAGSSRSLLLEDVEKAPSARSDMRQRIGDSTHICRTSAAGSRVPV